ncbi:hypothetical protein SDC9_123717 [bioreactor metagenome]|uniref:Uncharacterized protein n=1 Tax=bioreactor metagenome TaxID=1076179 RepID=A0A645CII1_9ZZZZ
MHSKQAHPAARPKNKNVLTRLDLPQISKPLQGGDAGHWDCGGVHKGNTGWFFYNQSLWGSHKLCKSTKPGAAQIAQNFISHRKAFNQTAHLCNNTCNIGAKYFARRDDAHLHGPIISGVDGHGIHSYEHLIAVYDRALHLLQDQLAGRILFTVNDRFHFPSIFCVQKVNPL